MDEAALAYYLELLETAKKDPEYRLLCMECARLDTPILALLRRLPEKDRELLMDYIGVTGAANLRLVEIACTDISSQGKNAIGIP